MSKATRKKHVRPKSDMETMHISQPYAFKHDLHVGHGDYEERLVDTRPVSPPAPCPGSKDSSGDNTVSSETISQLLKGEIIPALRDEISDIVDSKLLNNKIIKSSIPHCQTCTCSNKDRINKQSSLIDTETEISNIREAEDRCHLYERPTPCTVVIGEDINLPENKTGMNVIAVSDIQDPVDISSISHPVYHHKEQTILIQTQPGTNLMKYGSDIQLTTQLKRGDLSTNEHSLVLARSQTLPGLTKSAESPVFEWSEIQNKYRGRPLSKFDHRECLAHALQWHIEDLVDGVVFKDSELPDSLLEDGCLTEEECSGVRQKLDRRDQVRVLLRIIKGRDLDILERFVRNIRSHNVSVAERIEGKFHKNLNEGMRCAKCALCKLTTQVNLKYIVDSLWRHSIIEDGLFNLIVDTEKPTGAQDDLWKQVIPSLTPLNVRNVLVKALTVKQHYLHIAQGIERMISAHAELQCHCKIQKKMITAESVMSLVSSRSPPSSDSEMVPDSHSDISRISKEVENATKIDLPMRNVSKDYIITEQYAQKRSDIERVQPTGLDNSTKENPDKVQPPVTSRKKAFAMTKALLSEWELETSNV